MNKPNIVIIYADDLGYGDLSCYGAQDILTPNVDKLLEHGIQLNNGYTASTVCTPARYSLITGQYPFRNEKTKILPGNAGCIIPTNMNTLPKVLKQGGYTTAVVGKWHLGLGNDDLDWNKEISVTPNDIGFDHSFIFPATNDRVPCVYVQNRSVLNLDPADPIEVTYSKQCPYDDIDTYEKNPEKLRMRSSHGHCHSIINGVGRVGYMRGGKKALWKDEDLAERFLKEATDFVDKSGDTPFFLFYPLHQPHVPRLPNEKFAGKSKLGPRGDVILELDWCVGELTAHLEKIGKLDNTIIIFSSDNGPVLDDGYEDGSPTDNGAHSPTGGLRGGKYSKYDGGARVPFIISWKNQIQARSSDALFCQTDFMASFASMLNIDLAQDDAVDSINLIDFILGQNDIGRQDIMFEGTFKGHSLRTDNWEYIPICEGPEFTPNSNVETGNSTVEQLFNMKFDRAQTKNLAAEYPEIVANLKARVAQIENSTKTR